MPLVCALVAAIGLLAHPAFAQADRTAATFWKTVQATCDATAAKPPSELGKRIAQTAIDEFTRFGGHRIDSNGRLFRFGLTEAEHEEDDGGSPQASLGHLGWWQVMKYWRALFGSDTADKLEVRGYRDASTSTQETQAAALLRTICRAGCCALPRACPIRRSAKSCARRPSRAAIVDTSWSAAFVSYVIRQSGVAPNAFRFANAHRVYIYDAFATSAAELANEASERLYRACPLSTPASRWRFDLPTARGRARRRQRRGGARAHPGGTCRQRRRAHGPAHPLRGGRACRCAGAQGVHHRRQRQSGGHRQEAEPQAAA